MAAGEGDALPSGPGSRALSLVRRADAVVFGYRWLPECGACEASTRVNFSKLAEIFLWKRDRFCRLDGH